MAPAKLKGTSSFLVRSWEPSNLCTLLYLRSSVLLPIGHGSFALWVSVPLSKGGAICSTILAAAVKVLCSYCRVYLYLYRVPYCAVSLCGNAVLLSRLYA